MPLKRFRAHVDICVVVTGNRAFDEAKADLHAMSQAHSNKSLQVVWLEKKIGG